MPDVLDQKYAKLKSLIASYQKVIVALSGGLDSSFLLYATVDTLGPDNTKAAIGISPSLPKSEFQFAKQFAFDLGLPENQILLIETEELQDPNYTDNPPNRCYFCKSELYDKLSKLAEITNAETICDGANLSDIGDHRPGMVAAKERKVRSPLLEADLSKDEIRALAQKFNLSVWNKPQSACLSSRIPYGMNVTKEKLQQIEAAEEFLRSLGFTQLRVRHHDTIARIELPLADMQKVVANGTREEIELKFREIGFLFTTLDIAGFRSGSMNVMLKDKANG